VGAQNKFKNQKSKIKIYGGYGVIAALGFVEPLVRMQIPLATQKKNS
jgi:hypothetical protein